MLHAKTVEGTKQANLLIAQELIKKKEYDAAITLYTHWHELTPHDIDILKARRAAFLKKGDFEKAKQDFEAIVKLEKEKFIDSYTIQHFDAFFEERHNPQVDDREELLKSLKFIASLAYDAKKHFEAGRYQEFWTLFATILFTRRWENDIEIFLLAAKRILLGSNEGMLVSQEALLQLKGVLINKINNLSAARTVEQRKILCKLYYAVGKVYELLGIHDDAYNCYFLALKIDKFHLDMFHSKDELKPEFDTSLAEQEVLFTFFRNYPEFPRVNIQDPKVQQKLGKLTLPEVKELKGNHEKLHAHYQARALFCRKNKLYDLALFYITMSIWINESYSKITTVGQTLSAPNVLKNIRDEIFKRDMFVDQLAVRAFSDQVVIVAFESTMQSKAPHVKEFFTEEQRQKQFADVILNRIDEIDSKKPEEIDEGIKFLQEAEKKLPEDIRIRLKLGQLLCTANRFIDAVEVYQVAQKNWPKENKLKVALEKALAANTQSWIKGITPIPLLNSGIMLVPTGKVQTPDSPPASEVKDAPKTAPAKKPKEFPKMPARITREQPKKVIDQKTQEAPKRKDTAVFFKEQQEARLQHKDQQRKQRNQRKATQRKEAHQKKAAEGGSRRQAKAIADAEIKRRKDAQDIINAAIAKRAEEAKAAEDKAKQVQQAEAKVQQEQQAEAEAKAKALAERKAAAPFGDMWQLPVVATIPISPIEYTLMDAMEKSSEFAVALLCGSIMRFRLNAVVSPDKKMTDYFHDVDMNSPLSADEIKSSTTQFGVQPLCLFQRDEQEQKIQVERDDLFQMQTFVQDGDNPNLKLNIQIHRSSHKKYGEDIAHRDFTINAPTADKTGQVRDATKRALQDIKNRQLVTIKQPTANSFEEDPYRALRAGILLFAGYWAEPEFIIAMEDYAEQIPAMKNIHYVHSWMRSHFSTQISPQEAAWNFDFLLHEFENPYTHKKWNFLGKLFGDDNAKKIIAAKEWICHELQITQPYFVGNNLHMRPEKTTQVYMLFFVAIAMNTDNYNPKEGRTQIFKDSPLLTILEGYPAFGPMYREYQTSFGMYETGFRNPSIAWQKFKPAASNHAQQQNTPQVQANGVGLNVEPPRKA